MKINQTSGMKQAQDHSRLAQSFFDDFVDAFRSFSGDSIAQRYFAPCLAFHGPASIQVFASKADIAGYFQRIVDGYHAKGCRSCRYKDMDVTAVGGQVAVGTVTWEL